MVKLVYIGKYENMLIHRDPAAFMAGLRAKLPGVSETGIQAIFEREKMNFPLRSDKEVVNFLGRDLLTDTPLTVPAFDLLSQGNKLAIYDYEHQRVHPATERLALLDPLLPLEVTYVWRLQNRFVQEVSAEDAAVIRQSPARHWFRNYDTIGDWRPGSTWKLPVLWREGFSSTADFEAFKREMKRRQQWTGV